jgi:hypothetical protein
MQGLVPGPYNTKSVRGAGHFTHRWLPLWSVLRYFLLCCVTPFSFLTGYGGTCSNGTCESGSLLDTAKVTPRFSIFFLRDLRRSLTDLRASPWARANFYTGLVCGKLTDLNSDHRRCGSVSYHRTLGYHQ